MIKLSKTGLYTIYLTVFVCLLSGSMLFNGCKQSGTAFQPTGDTVADGQKLVQKYCTSCHQLVPANFLTNDVWRFHTLPSMSHYLGLSTYGDDYFKKRADAPGISLNEWSIILAYYKKVAPEKLETPKPPLALENNWAGFSLRKPVESKKVVYTTMVKVNPSDQKIYTSDYQSAKLQEWDKNLKVRDVAQLPSPALDLSFIKDDKGAEQALVTCIGQLQPIDFPNGRIVKVDLNSKTEIANPALVESDLARPVQSISGDFNKDGLTDWIVCGEGFKQGGVYLLKQNKDHTFTQSNISSRAGAVQAIAGDYNNDGWQDLMILFGSGDEGLWLFTNDQKGGFTSKNLLRFPPVYGSSSFQLADINHDGKLDLVYTAGYNYFDSRILKPYHGVYIFTNQGDWNFKQTWFYPINGCTKAVVTDFDGDGDFDIATIAFFADMKSNPGESFIYFEQDKPGSFKPHAVPVSQNGHWMSMDVADLNKDGKPDIVLGNYGKGFLFQPDFKPEWNQNLPFIILENHNKK
jgi:FG-GAP-like repeat